MDKKPTKDILKKATSSLQSLYAKIPETKGCMENIETCRAWCCKVQNPQVLYVEFLNTWETMMRTWELDDILTVVEDSVMCYISRETTKGCVFFDKEKYLCKQHKTRCFNCRIYGITPKEEFEPRYLAMKELLKKYPNAIFHNQCNLVSTKDGSPIEVGQTDIWWKKLTGIENFIGIERNRINDGKTGTYRTYHDHILLNLLPDDILSMLTKLKTSEVRPEDRYECIKSFMKCLRDMIASALEVYKNKNVSPEENKNS